MAEETPLTQRLVHATQAALDDLGFVTWKIGPDVAGPAVLAMLRKLDAVLEEERRDYLSQERLRALADSIEKGGE